MNINSNIHNQMKASMSNITNIIVNGKEHALMGTKESFPRVSYDTIVRCAGYNRTEVLTVTFSYKGRGGSLIPGNYAEITEGMVFNVGNTSNS